MEEYNLPLGLDIDKIIQRAQTVSGILNNLNTQAQNVGASAQAAFTNASGAANAAGRSFASQATAFGSSTRSIENMRDALNDMRQMLPGERDTARIRFLNREIQSLEQQIRRTSNVGRDGFDQFGDRIRNAGRQADVFSGVMKKVGAVLVATFGVQAIISFGKELAELSVKASGIERAFSRLGDSNSLAKLRAETKGFVTDLDLEKLTVKANNFNIPVAKLGTFLDFAQQRAKATGESVEKLTNNIIDGLGRKSSRIIDNLGISIVDIQAEFKKTGDFTLAVSNLIEREMGAAGVQVDTLADKANRISVSFDNAKKSLAGFLAQLFNPDVADNDKIAIITQKNLKQFNDFTKKSAEDRTKILIDQEKKVAEASAFYQQTPRVVNSVPNMIAKGTFFDAPNDAARKRAGERLAAEQNILQTLKEQNREAQINDRVQKGILSVEELRAKVVDLREKATNIVPTTDADKAQRSKLLQEAKDIQTQIDEIVGVSNKKRDATEESAAKKRADRMKVLGKERVRLENEMYSAQIEAIEDGETKAVAAETVGSQNRLRELEERKKTFPELEKEIDRLILEEKAQSILRVALIIKKGQEEELKQRKASQQEIARVLRDDTAAQIDAIENRYDTIVENAKKAGTLTTEIEKSLAAKRIKEVNDVTIKAQTDSLSQQEDIALSGILLRSKKENVALRTFERQNQEDILRINIEFAQKKLNIIATDPAKVEEANKLRKAIQDATNEIAKLQKVKSVDLLEILGIDGDKLKGFSDAVSKVGEIAGELFSALAEGAQQKVDAIQEQIDAIDDLISAQEDAVDKEKELLDKGYANNYANAQKTLEAQKQQRAQLLKEQEEAQKQQQALQRAQIIADGIAQASNLITASTDIFKVFAKIPFIGVPLAIAAIATMFGAFTVAKVNAFNATKLAEGGTAGGKSHAEGGNKYVSMDGRDSNILEIEKGEEVIKKTSSDKHRKALKAFNADDFSTLSIHDISIQQMLDELGILTQLDESKSASRNNIAITSESKTIVVNTQGKSEGYLKSMDARLKSIEALNKTKANLLDMGDYYIIVDGNYKQKIWKK